MTPVHAYSLPVSLEHRTLPELIRWAILAALGSCLLFLAVHYAVNNAVYRVDKEPAREHLRHAFETGELGVEGSLPLNSTLGVHQENDCLIFDMASRDSAQWVTYLFAASISGASERRPRCELLRASVTPDPLMTVEESWYQRYLHGYRPVAIVLLRFFEVHTARQIMKASSYGVFVLLFVINLGLLLRRRRLAPANRGGSETAHMAIAGCLLGLFGLPYFGQSISHAPAIVTLGVFLIAWSIYDYRHALTLRRAAWLVIGYALFTAYFEYLTGYIPVAVSLLTLLVAIGTQPSRGFRDLAVRLVFLQSLFAGCVVGVLALNLVFSAAFSGEGQVLGKFIDALMFRMSDERVSSLQELARLGEQKHLAFGEVLAQVATRLPHLGLPDRLTGVTCVLAALGVLLVGLGEVWLSNRTRDLKWRTTLIAGSVLPLLAWLFAFGNHTYVHSSFMVRIVVIVFLAAFVMLAWLFRVRASASAPRVPIASAQLLPVN